LGLFSLYLFYWSRSSSLFCFALLRLLPSFASIVFSFLFLSLLRLDNDLSLSLPLISKARATHHIDPPIVSVVGVVLFSPPPALFFASTAAPARLPLPISPPSSAAASDFSFEFWTRTSAVRRGTLNLWRLMYSFPGRREREATFCGKRIGEEGRVALGLVRG